MKNADKDKRIIELGLKIAYYRKMRKMTQEQLAEIVGKNPGYISQVETPSVYQPISMSLFLDIADALDVEPYKLWLTD